MTIDRAALTELKFIMEDEFSTLIETYIRDSLERLNQLRQAIAEGDCAQVRATAHSFKGSSSNICAPGLAELCRQLEQQAGDQDLSQAVNLFAQIEAEFQQVHTQFNSL